MGDQDDPREHEGGRGECRPETEHQPAGRPVVDDVVADRAGVGALQVADHRDIGDEQEDHEQRPWRAKGEPCPEPPDERGHALGAEPAPNPWSGGLEVDGRSSGLAGRRCGRCGGLAGRRCGGLSHGPAQPWAGSPAGWECAAPRGVQRSGPSSTDTASDSRSLREASATSTMAASKTSALRADGTRYPLTFRTNWRAAASISPVVVAVSDRRRVLMLRHMTGGYPFGIPSCGIHPVMKGTPGCWSNRLLM